MDRHDQRHHLVVTSFKVEGQDPERRTDPEQRKVKIMIDDLLPRVLEREVGGRAVKVASATMATASAPKVEVGRQVGAEVGSEDLVVKKTSLDPNAEFRI